MNRYKVILIFCIPFLIQCVQKEKIQNQIKNDIDINTGINRQIASSSIVCKNEKSKYLEKQIQALPFEYLKNYNSRWQKKIPLACIQFAQQNFKGPFAYCRSENDKPIAGAPKPCLSENYTNLVYNAYHDVKNCFNLDPKNSFLQIMIESGFHVNAFNKTGSDAGISQFTKNGILRVMERDIINKTSQLLLESSNPSCERISGVFRDLPADAFKVERRCSMISLPQNPYRAFVMHYLHTLRDQMDLKRNLATRSEIYSVMNDRILEQLVYMAYNRGIQGTLRLLDGYIKSRKKAGAAIKTEDLDLWINLSQARIILKNDPEKRLLLKKAKIIKKLSFAEYAMIYDQNYLANMTAAGELVNARVGAGCF